MEAGAEVDAHPVGEGAGSGHGDAEHRADRALGSVGGDHPGGTDRSRLAMRPGQDRGQHAVLVLVERDQFLAELHLADLMRPGGLQKHGFELVLRAAGVARGAVGVPAPGGAAVGRAPGLGCEQGRSPHHVPRLSQFAGGFPDG